jgi:hypothetical protein
MAGFGPMFENGEIMDRGIWLAYNHPIKPLFSRRYKLRARNVLFYIHETLLTSGPKGELYIRFVPRNKRIPL